MTTRAARRIANAMIAATVLLQLASASLELSSRAVGEDQGDDIYVVLSVLAAATYLLIGRMIVTRRPANTIGWLLMSIPLIATFAFANGDYAVAALVDKDSTLPFGTAGTAG